MAFDVAAVMKELDDVSAEDRQVLERIMNSSKKLQGGFLRQSDYDRNQNAIKEQAAKEKAELEARIAEREAAVEAEAVALAKWKKNQEDGPLKEATEAVAAATAREKAAKDALERAITDAGLERDTYLKGLETTPDDKGRKEPPVVDDKGKADDRYVGKDKFERGVIGAVVSNAELMDLANEHLRVFGKPLEGVKALVERTLARANKGEQVSIRSVWAEEHKVDDALKAKSDAEIAQRIKDAEEAAYTRGRSEAALGGRPGETESASPVLRMAAKKEGVHVAGVRPSVEAAVKAMSELQTAKRVTP